MQAQVFGATVARYGSYGNADRPLVYERGEFAGKSIEFVDVLVEAPGGEVATRRLTLHGSINGERPPVGTVCDLICRVSSRSEVVFRRDGSERIVERDKWRVEAFAQPEQVAATGKAA